MASVQKINIVRRAELCIRIIHGERDKASAALVDLASMYQDAGYATLALALLGSTLSGARDHARALLMR